MSDERARPVLIPPESMCLAGLYCRTLRVFMEPIITDKELTAQDKRELADALMAYVTKLRTESN